MTYSQLLTIFLSTDMSPEEIAPRLSISNMTFRRWMKEDSDCQVPRGYLPQIAEATYQLISEGHLDHRDKKVGLFLANFRSRSHLASLMMLGVTNGFDDQSSTNQDRMISAVARIGSSLAHRLEVESSKEKIRFFFDFGSDWKSSLQLLLEVVESNKINVSDKLVAYGALFYLIFPFDLIPDSVPVFGYLDDFAVISLALIYYKSRTAITACLSLERRPHV